MVDPVSFNPLAGNPLKTRADVERALHDLFNPLLPYFSEGGARVRLDGSGAHFDRAAADLEGWARPLWGLAPLGAGGGEFAHWPLFAKGLANGTDPEHPEYWGRPKDRDQRLVELAAIGFAIRMVPQHLWAPLDERAKANVIAYLIDARERAFANNNWQFFRVMIDLALDEVGADFDRSLTTASLEELDGYYIADGWYRDGNYKRIDHYIPFAMHFYGLIYSALSPKSEWAERFRARARRFAPDFASWFADDGGALAFGRSMTYRFACGGFWGALAFAGEDALPWGQIKGHYMRHLRWWANYPIAHRDGVLSVGFGYPQQMMSESYNSAGSPYWALKAFLPLMLPEDHPFWQAEEEDAPRRATPLPLRHPGMVMMETQGNVVALSSGQENIDMRVGTEKYAKFAYSSRYGFGVEVEERGFDKNGFDNALAFSDDALHYRVRETNEEALIAGHALRAVWRPWLEVRVETTLVPAGDWHVRIHRIVTPRALQTVEGGFAIGRADGDSEPETAGDGAATAASATDFSAILDLGSSVLRKGRAQKALPNTNLIHPKTTVPQLAGDIPAGETLLVSAVLAVADPQAGDAAFKHPPAVPDMAALDRLFAEEGVRVSALDLPA